MNGGHSPVILKGDRKAVHEDDTTTVAEATENNIAPNHGAMNRNWNLSDQLRELAIEEYEQALKLGYVGTRTEWEQYFEDLHQFVGNGLLTAPIDDKQIAKAAGKAVKITVKYRMHPFLKAVLFFTSIFSIVLTLAGGGGAYLVSTAQTGKRVVDHRPCKLEKDGVTINGVRSYSYLYKELFGIRWLEVDKISERTEIDVSFAGLTAVAISGDDSKTIIRGKGEGGVLILPSAQYYVFMTEGRATSVTYNNLCE